MSVANDPTLAGLTARAGIAALLLWSSAFAQERAQILVEDLNPETTRQLSALQSTRLPLSELRVLEDRGAAVLSVEPDQAASATAELQALLANQSAHFSRLGGDYRELFTSVPPNSDLSVNSQRLLSTISARGNSVTLVKLAPAALATHALTQGYDARDGIPIPGSFLLQLTDNVEVTVVRESSTFSSNGFVWQGSVTGETPGRALLVSNVDGLSGTVTMGRIIYKIQPLGQRMHAIVRQQLQDLPPEHPPASSNGTVQDGAARDLPPSDPLGLAEEVTLDVLVAYTSRVQSVYLNVDADLIAVAMAETNASLQKSGVGNLSVRLAGTIQVDYDESQPWERHLRRLRGMAKVNRAREESSADIVVLIVDAGEFCGEAMAVGASAETGFAVVARECATGNYSFGHELGHLFGARHDTGIDGSSNPYAHGHGYLDSGAWRTIMAYGTHCGGCPRLPFWSNPFISYGGQPTGTVGREFNAKVLMDEAKRLSRFR